MTTVYFVRHAEPDYENHDDFTRPLTPKGKNDTRLVTEFLSNKDIDIAFSSPYLRSVDTIMPFCQSFNLDINIEEKFRERKISNKWIDEFDDFAEKQWKDFNYKLNDGENLNEVTARNIAATKNLVDQFPNKNIVVASHGTTVSCIINYYYNKFGYSDFHRIKKLTPWIVRFEFDGEKCLGITEYNLFTHEIILYNPKDLQPTLKFIPKKEYVKAKMYV